jgi:hypothetical protein
LAERLARGFWLNAIIKDYCFMKLKKCLIGLLLLTSCSKGKHGAHSINGEEVFGTLITKAQYGPKWPFSADSLYLFRGEKFDVYTERKDTIYALNSVASDRVDAGEFGDFQMWHLMIKNPNYEQMKTKEEIEKLGMAQMVNILSRRF